MTRPATWQVATGHAETTRAAAGVLRDGGNAIDAAIAAALAACVAEPIFCSLGGGGHALVKPAGRAPVMLDFFAQTPGRRRIEGLDFYPITGNFGPDTQEFHVGMGAVAVPGMVAGLWALHQRHGSLPMQRLAGPARDLAAGGVILNETQAYALRILEPIVRANDGSARMFGLDRPDGALPLAGGRVRNPELARFLELLVAAGPERFYCGETARTMAAESVHHGGHLTLADLEGYRVRWRRPLRWTYRDARLWSNPPPAFGGVMVALATRGLEQHLPASARFGSPVHFDGLCRAMADSEDLRLRLEQPEHLGSGRALLSAYRSLPESDRATRRGTTHISVLDTAGHGVSMTITNGEGCGRVVPGCGFMLNNMLGEQDINRAGFHRWPENRRLASMVAPTLLEHAGHRYLLGSGGSNRIRTALAQVISNLVDFGLPLERAVTAPRLHLESGALGIEMSDPVLAAPVESWLDAHYPDARRWPGLSLFFGGVNAVSQSAAAADPRRNGEAISGSDAGA